MSYLAMLVDLDNEELDHYWAHKEWQARLEVSIDYWERKRKENKNGNSNYTIKTEARS